MGKEVSNNIIVILVLIAVVISVVGSYMVFMNASNLNSPASGNVVITTNQPEETTGQVVLVINPKNSESGGGK